MLGTSTKIVKLWLNVAIVVLSLHFSAQAQQPVVVWPGDTNLDGIVNNEDLFNIGLAFGAVGPPRPNGSIVFQPDTIQQFWPQNLPGSMLNFAYIDCNGDGIINDLDIAAVDQNYLLMHPDVAPQFNDTLPGLPGPAILEFFLPNDTVGFGDSVMILVNVESPGFPGFIDSVVYGVSFTVNYNVDFTKDDATSISFPDTWLGQQGNSINLGKVRTDTLFALSKSALVPGESGKVDAVKVRTDGKNVKGTGEEFGVCIVMDENIFKPASGGSAIIMPTEIFFSDIKMISNDGRIIPVMPFDDLIFVAKPASCDTATVVQNLTEANISFSTVTLNWDTVADAAGYIIQGGLASTPPANVVSLNISGGSTGSFDVAGLIPGATYQWRIKPICNSGIDGQFSGINNFTMNLCPVPAPISTSNITPNFALLTWTGQSNAIGYQIIGGVVGNPSKITLNVTDALQTNLPVNDLIPGTTYEWKIRTACGSLSSLKWSVFSNTEVFSTPFNASAYHQKNPSNEQVAAKVQPRLFPNPAANVININTGFSKNEELKNISIYDVSGNMILKQSFTAYYNDNQQLTISTKDISAGIYCISIHSNLSTYTDKIFIIK